ncbi:MAG: hypothetical protein KF746_13570 [Chitinophagaceae bacterium]|nr:hypothetical protein [Chitinophagaceae bacterium]
MKKNLLLFFVFALVQHTCFADGYWLELQGSGNRGDTLLIKIRYGGVDEQKNRYINNGAALDKMKDYQLFVIDSGGRQHNIPLKQAHDHWAGYYVPLASGSFQVFAVNNSLPVVEREDTLQNIKPVQYLCAAYTVGKSSKLKIPAAHLYIEAGIQNDTARVVPFIDGKPVAAGTPLRVFLPDNHDIKVTVTKKGYAVLPVRVKGNYLIRLDDMDRQEGFYEGKKYYATRHRCDYSLVAD